MCDKLISQNNQNNLDGFLAEDAIPEQPRNIGMASLKKREAIPFLLIFAILLLIACKKEATIPDPTVSITANPIQINYNGTSVINWSSTNADYCNLNGSKVNSYGSLTVNLATTTKYAITAYGQGRKTASNEITVTVNLPSAPFITLTGVPTSPIPYYDSTKFFSWVVMGEVSSVKLDNVTVANSGTFKIPKLVRDTTFTLTAIGPGGTTISVVPITVGDWTTSEQGLLTGPNLFHIAGKDWGIEKQEYNDIFSNNQWVERYPLTTEDKAVRYFYSLDGFLKIYHTSNGIEPIIQYQLVNENGDFLIKDESGTLKILELTETKLLVLYVGTIYDTVTQKYYVSYTKSTFKRYI